MGRGRALGPALAARGVVGAHEQGAGGAVRGSSGSAARSDLGALLLAVRDASVLEQHKRRLLGPSGSPVRAAIPQVLDALGKELFPHGGESWSSKLRRALRALRHPRTPLAEHRQAIGQAPRKPEIRSPPQWRASGNFLPTDRSAAMARSDEPVVVLIESVHPSQNLRLLDLGQAVPRGRVVRRQERVGGSDRRCDG